jgi:hypothetical protein
VVTHPASASRKVNRTLRCAARRWRRLTHPPGDAFVGNGDPMTQNQFGLDRSIDAATKRTVRQRCGFGCAICGCAIIQYHHFDPLFADAKSHDPSGITLLCGQCHDRAHRGIIGKAAVSSANAAPKCKELGYSKDLLFIGDSSIPVRFGSSRVRAATVLMYDDRVVVGFSKPEHVGAPLQLNAIFTDDNANEVLRVVDNEWQVGIDRYDIFTEKDRLTVKDAPGDIVLEMSLAVGTEICIRRLRMKYLGFSIICDEDSFSLTTPSGARLGHRGDVVADIGIWMKSTGEALMAANSSGGAAVRIGR